MNLSSTTENSVVLDFLDQFPSRIGRVFQIGELEIALFRTSENEIYAIENKNPHPKGGPLAESIVSEHYIYDPLYDWKIDLKTGRVQSPEHGQVRVFRTGIVNGEVIVFPNISDPGGQA